MEGDERERARRASGSVGVAPRTRAPGPGPSERPRARSLAVSWCLGVPLAVVSVPLVARWLDVDGPTPLPQLLAFLPWFLVPGWLVLVCTVLTRRWALVAWAAVALGATGWFLQPYGADAPDGAAERPATAQFRVLTANVEFGGATRALVQTLREEHPQLVAVEECTARCMRALRTAELRDLYPHRVLDEGPGADGSALLSTFPLDNADRIRGSQMRMPSATARIGESRLRVQVVHPMPPDLGETGPWKRELGLLRHAATRERDEPLLLAGDFNSSADHAAFRSLLDTGLADAARQTGQSRTPTWPTTTAPPLGAQIDHVLLGDRLVAISADFLDLPGTDHRALLTDVKLFPEEGKDDQG